MEGVTDGQAKGAECETYYNSCSEMKNDKGRNLYPTMKAALQQLVKVTKAKVFPGYTWGPEVRPVPIRARGAEELPVTESVNNIQLLQIKYIEYY